MKFLMHPNWLVVVVLPILLASKSSYLTIHFVNSQIQNKKWQIPTVTRQAWQQQHSNAAIATTTTTTTMLTITLLFVPYALPCHGRKNWHIITTLSIEKHRLGIVIGNYQKSWRTGHQILTVILHLLLPSHATLLQIDYNKSMMTKVMMRTMHCNILGYKYHKNLVISHFLWQWQIMDLI